jgi:transcriptional regulator with XRE-family HTH domain
VHRTGGPRPLVTHTLMPRKRSSETVAFGAALRSLRVERGYSQESFAAYAGIDRSYYGAIERGEFNVSLETMLKLAGALDVSVVEVLRRAVL